MGKRMSRENMGVRKNRGNMSLLDQLERKEGNILEENGKRFTE